MTKIEIKHPTHIGASTNKDGQHCRPLYLEINDKGNWVEFCKSPGEWDVETGAPVHPSTVSWDHYLVDICEVTQEDLVEYWIANQQDAERTRKVVECDVEKAAQALARKQESLGCCDDWAAWTAAHLQDVQDD